MKFKDFLIGFLTASLVFALFNLSALAVKQYSNSFSDVDIEDWYYLPIMELSEDGYFSGYEDGTFQPSKAITRAEAAKLFYLIESDNAAQMLFLENEIRELQGLPKLDSSGTVLEDDSDDADESDVILDNEDDENEESEEQTVLNISADINGEINLRDGYSLFEEINNAFFAVQYPSHLFWNNTLGGLEDGDAVIWYTVFAEEDFSELSDDEEAENTIAVGLVYTDDYESEREAIIFIEKTEEQSFIVEGDFEDLDVLQKMAVSFRVIDEDYIGISDDSNEDNSDSEDNEDDASEENETI